MKKLSLISDYQKNLPFNSEAEQAVIGSILLTNEIYDDVSLILNSDNFFDPLHQKIVTAIENLISKGLLANPITLKNYFENDEGIKEIGGSEYLVRLTKFSTTAKQASDYAKIVYEMHLRRQLIKISENILDNASNQSLTSSGL